MALVSPGTSVSIVDESVFVSNTAKLVPLIYIATASEKLNSQNLPAVGTYEHHVIRTVTSMSQSLELYGTPRFLRDSQDNAHHGDARNEYGLFALNQYLGVGNLAYVIRANVNLNDDRTDILDMWDAKVNAAADTLENLAVSLINEYNELNGYIPSNPNFKETITKSELLSLVTEAMGSIYDLYNFSTIQPDFENDHTITPLLVYPNGYNQPPVPTAPDGFLGMGGLAQEWVDNLLGSLVSTEFTPVEAQQLLIQGADQFKYTVEFLYATSLGANDAARRVAITTALQAAINSVQEIKSEIYEFNVVLCPGYPEVADELVNLSLSVNEEAFVIADAPMDQDPFNVANSWAVSSARQNVRNIGYYYPHGIASNVDGFDVLCAASGIALRAFVLNDDVAEPWFAPAGSRRGVVTGVTGVGYVSGSLGGATTFNEVNLNQGQRDILYTKALNPIVFFPGRGLLIFGQKTSQGFTSALDRINVMRMLMFVKRQIRKGLLPFVFEPNDAKTRDDVAAVVRNFLSDVRTKRGLVDFIVVCDESNNSAQNIENNELVVDIALKPTKTAEFVLATITVVRQDASLT